MKKHLEPKCWQTNLPITPDNLKQFWKEVQKLNSSPPVAQTVAGVNGDVGIAAMWKNHFSDILNSADGAKEAVLERLRADKPAIDPFTVPEVLEALNELSLGRSPGCDELYAEHFRTAGIPCATHLSLCFSMMMRHKYLPQSLTDVVLCPIVKDKTGDVTDKGNYRPIALATVCSKILEKVILKRCRLGLVTSDHQFGFKNGHSTDMAVFAFKEIVDHYLRNSSPVFICFLDARKAFDRVNHWTLFDKLLRRGVAASIVQLLASWYGSQTFRVMWGSCLSEGFHVSNGVRQGGILSPYLFNVYIDELSYKLDSSGVGCHYLGSVNHLCYADDMVLLSPTPQGLQKLLDVCARYADAHDIAFNVKKTVCMAILPSLFKSMSLPDIVLNGTVLSL